MNTTVYKSKIGLELALPIAVTYAGILIFILQNPVNWPGVAIILALILITLHTFFKTSYTLSGENLFIRCGTFYHIKIPVNSINKIEKSNSLFSAPATSLNRLALYYENHKMVLISPKYKKEFMAHLASLNPAIEIILNKPS